MDVTNTVPSMTIQIISPDEFIATNKNSINKL